MRSAPRFQSGLTVKFVYKVDLLRSSAAWFDRKIASAVVIATVKYDTLHAAATTARARWTAHGVCRDDRKRKTSRGAR
jgi:hypothetical protein